MSMKHLAILAAMAAISGDGFLFTNRYGKISESKIKRSQKSYGKRMGLNQRQRRKLNRQTQNF